MFKPLFIKDIDFKLNAPLKHKTDKIKYNVSWNYQKKNTSQSFNLEFMAKEILLGFTLKQNDQLNFQIDFGDMNIQNLGVLRPKFTYSFNKLIQANDISIKLKLDKNSNQFQLKFQDQLKEGLLMTTKIKRIVDPFTLQWSTETKFNNYFQHSVLAKYQNKDKPYDMQLQQNFNDYLSPQEFSGKLAYHYKKTNVSANFSVNGSMNSNDKNLTIKSDQKLKKWLKLKENFGTKSVGGEVSFKMNKQLSLKLSTSYKWKQKEGQEFALPLGIQIKLGV